MKKIKSNIKNILLILNIFFSLLFVGLNGIAQDYLLNFTSSGLSTSIESIEVINLNSEDTLIINGNDVLHLKNYSEVEFNYNSSENLIFFPNPMTYNSEINLNISKSGTIFIIITEISGKTVFKKKYNLISGNHTFNIGGLPKGIYLLNVFAPENHFVKKVVSLVEKSDEVWISYQEYSFKNISTRSDCKSESLIVEMPYQDGDLLLFKASSSDFSRVLTLIPTESQTVNFEFISCSDAEGNNYPVVTIGAQTWMAENLAFLPSVVGYQTVGSYTEPYYYVLEYSGVDVEEAKATENYKIYGVLYNWTAAQTACPSGWRLPSDDDWKELEIYLGMSLEQIELSGFRGTNEGSKLAGNINLWSDGELKSDSEFGLSGFRAIPKGPEFTDMDPGSYVQMWSNTEIDSNSVWTRYLASQKAEFGRGTGSKLIERTIRCVKN
ncbi:MAG TPA: FISUMP domain-containing protein [Bacteroidales bacterium]|nr:FISUMP domain-containing protein [Bacteroidales bacterium]